MNELEVINSFFANYFINNQNSKDGSWSPPADRNIISKTVYTCQVLSVLKYIDTSELLEKSILKAVDFLLKTSTENTLYDVYLKTNSLTYWKQYIPEEELFEKVLYESSKNQELGGRLNAFSFEFCFILESLLSTNVYSKIGKDTKDRFNNTLISFINKPIEYYQDISHFTWALKLYQQLGNKIDLETLEKLNKLLKQYPKSRGFYNLNAPINRPSKTPALRSDEFLTGHIVYDISIILQKQFYLGLFQSITEDISVIISTFSVNQMWNIISKLTGIIQNDVYISALFLKAIKEYSLISTEAYRKSLHKIYELTKFTHFEILKSMEKNILFISHSEKDEEYASKLIEFIESSMNTEDIEIRCSSVAGYKLLFGKSISQQLKEDIYNSEILIVLISKNSISSGWVLFELGAAWALDIPVIPIIDKGLTYKSLPGPLGSQSCIEMESETASSRLRDAIKQISIAFHAIEKTGGKSQKKLDELLLLYRK